MNIETLHKIDTEYSADSVEWCPHAGWRNYFVCGTYQLMEEPTATTTTTPSPQDDDDNAEAVADNPLDAVEPHAQQRKGRLYAYRYDRCGSTLTLCDTVETAAILDLKWSPTPPAMGATPIVAAATALGEVQLYRLSVGGKLELTAGRTLAEKDADTVERDGSPLTLAIDWDSANNDGNVGQLVASDSHGRLTVLQCSASGGFDAVASWAAHSFEAWTCAFDRQQPNVVYSGGDDMLLCGWDTRSPHERVLQNRSHTAGVTALLSFGDRRLATGSYDELLRVFDTRQMRRPLEELSLGGGIWRIRQHPVRMEWLLCANMYHNFCVVRMDGGGGGGGDGLSVVAEYFEHKSICYGADWCWDGVDGEGRGGEMDGGHLMATCSFYDHTLCVANVKVADD